MTGGCAWGHNYLIQPTSTADGRFNYNMVVVDNKADGSCARVEVQEQVQFSTDPSPVAYKACGSGTSTPAQGTMYYHWYSAGIYTTGWHVRVCVGSNCTSWKSYSF